MKHIPVSISAWVRASCLPALWAAVLAAGGCASPLPTYPMSDPADGLRVIADRLAGVQTIQAGATVEFEEAGGRGVRLDGVLVARPPDQLRLRAWKFNRAVFDATLSGGDVWLLPVETDGRQDHAFDAGGAAAGLRRAGMLMSPAFFRGAGVDGGRIDGDELTCVIDRPTLTPRRFEQAGAGPGATAGLTIELSGYRLVGDVPWPMTWTISHPQGRIVIRTEDVSLNATIVPGAFTPPSRAVRNP